MAMIVCTECGKEISDKAKMCPHCGNPMTEQSPTEEKTEVLSEQAEQKKKKTEKSFLIRALLLWVLLVVEILAIGPIGMVIEMDATSSFLYACIIAAVNTVLAIILIFKSAKAIKRSFKAKKGIVKNLVAAMLCLAFLIPNGAFAFAGVYDYFFTNSTEEQMAVEAEALVGAWGTIIGDSVYTYYEFTADGKFISYAGLSEDSIMKMAEGEYSFVDGQLLLDMPHSEDETPSEFSVEGDILFYLGEMWVKVS